jgi:hypothetical protein
MSEDLQKLYNELAYWQRTENKAMNACTDHDTPAYQFHFGRFALVTHLISKIHQLTKKSNTKDNETH